MQKGMCKKKKSVEPVRTKPGNRYGNCNVHKQQVDGCRQFCPILSALETLKYNLAKFLAPIWSPVTKNRLKIDLNLLKRYVSKDSYFIYNSLFYQLNYFSNSMKKISSTVVRKALSQFFIDVISIYLNKGNIPAIQKKNVCSLSVHIQEKYLCKLELNYNMN